MKYFISCLNIFKNLIHQCRLKLILKSKNYNFTRSLFFGFKELLKLFNKEICSCSKITQITLNLDNIILRMNWKGLDFKYFMMAEYLLESGKMVIGLVLYSKSILMALNIMDILKIIFALVKDYNYTKIFVCILENIKTI